MKRAVFYGLILVFCGASAAFAMPGASTGADGKTAPQAGPGSGRFAAADTDKDGFLSKEEFAAAFPGLKAEAFTMIDRDGDGRIASEEWNAFSTGHGGGGKFPHGGSNGAGGTNLPVEPVPQGTGK